METIITHMNDRVLDLEALKCYPVTPERQQQQGEEVEDKQIQSTITSSLDHIISYFKSCEDQLSLLRIKLMQEEALFMIQKSQSNLNQPQFKTQSEYQQQQEEEQERNQNNLKPPAQNYLDVLDGFNLKLEHMLRNIPPEMPRVTDIHQDIQQERQNKRPLPVVMKPHFRVLKKVN